MQTQTTLPIQVSPASAAPQRTNASQGADSAQFSQALSREMEQRQHSPAPAASSQPARQQAAPASRPQSAQAPAQPPAKPADAKTADTKPAEGKPATASSDAGADAAKDDAADAAAATPVADMLALVASFNQPAAAAVTPAAASTEGALQAAALSGYAGKPAVAETETGDAAAAGTGKALPALASVADDSAPSFKEVAQAIDSAARLSIKALGGAAAKAAEPDAPPALPGAEAKAADAAAPKSTIAADTIARPATTDNKLAALAVPARASDAAQASDAAPAAGPAKADASLARAPLADASAVRTREAVAETIVPKEAPLAAPLMAPVQQASVAMAQAATGVPADRIAARVGTPGWDNQVGQKIIWMVAGKEQSASLTLNPPDMGPMQVVLNVTNDQATVTFTAAQPEVRQALENAMPKLREMMSESGIALGNATVNAGMPDQRQAQHGEQSRGQGSGARFGSGGSGPAVDGAPTPRPARVDGGAGLVDTFA
jgi:flagellar hook-length control protein FliK